MLLALLGMFSPFLTIQQKLIFWRWWSGFFLTKLLHFQKYVAANRTVLSPCAREDLYPRPGSYCFFQLLKPALSSLLPHPSSDSPCSTEGSGEPKTSWRSLYLCKMLPCRSLLALLSITLQNPWVCAAPSPAASHSLPLPQGFKLNTRQKWKSK